MNVKKIVIVYIFIFSLSLLNADNINISFLEATVSSPEQNLVEQCMSIQERINELSKDGLNQRGITNLAEGIIGFYDLAQQKSSLLQEDRSYILKWCGLLDGQLKYLNQERGLYLLFTKAIQKLETS